MKKAPEPARPEEQRGEGVKITGERILAVIAIAGAVGSGALAFGFRMQTLPLLFKSSTSKNTTTTSPVSRAKLLTSIRSSSETKRRMFPGYSVPRWWRLRRGFPYCGRDLLRW